MNGYKAFYKGKQIEVKAETTFEAQRKAAEIFKTKKPWEVSVTLCEKEGNQVTHVPTF